jgi:hypothetical protein
MKSVYRPILKVAWQNLWKAKYLWFFGFFAALVGNSGEFNLTINNFSALSDGVASLSSFKELYIKGLAGSFGSNLVGLFTNFSASAIVLIVILLAVLIFLIWLSVSAQAGLLFGAYKEYRKQPSDFASTFRAGRQNFWQILGLNVIGKVVVWGILLVLGLPLVLIYINQSSSVAQTIFIIIAFIVLIPISIIVSFIIKYASIFVVVRKDKIGVALKNSWKLFLENWLVSIEMAILLFLVSIATGIAMVLVGIIFAIPLNRIKSLF